MTWVVQVDPDNDKSFSPWKGCMWMGFDCKAWYATALAKPIQFPSEADAKNWVEKFVRQQFPKSKILVSRYEDVFQETMKKVMPEPTPPPLKPISELSDWGWNDNDDDVPF